MRKLAIILCVIIIMLSFLMCHREYTHGVYEITITESLNFNNSVGNEWKKVYTCEGKVITSGEQWTVPLDSTTTIKIDAKITEKDEWSDTNSDSLTVILKDGFQTSTNITVTENKGRFTGNTAQWKITCHVRLVKKLVQK